MFRTNFRFRKEKRKEDYCIFDPHSEPGFNECDKRFMKKIGKKGNDYIGIVSIDPGIVNIGLYITFFWNNGHVQSCVLERLDFSTEDRKNENDDNKIKVYNEAISKLDKHFDIISQTHFILIESQLSVNPNAMRMAQHFITYFSMKFKDVGIKPLIIEISPQLKTELLGGPKGREKGETKEKAKRKRKEWCRQKAEEILRCCHDDETAEFLVKKRAKKGEGKSKKDDMGDVVCQAFAWLVLSSQAEWWSNFIDDGYDLGKIINIEEN